MFKNLSTSGLGISGVESEIIELGVSFGFEGVDINLMDLFRRADEKGAVYARRLIDSAGLKIGTAVLPVNLQGDEESINRELEALKKIAPVAAEFNCPRMCVQIAPACDDRPYHESFEHYRARLAEIAEILAPHKIQLGISMKACGEAREGFAFEFIHTFSDLHKLSNATGHDNVGVVIDSFQWYAGDGTLDEIQAVELNEIVGVSLADAPQDVAKNELTDGQRVLPGETGAVDCVGILQHLQSIGYEGPVTPNPSRARFPKTGRIQIVRTLGESIDSMWVAIGLKEAPLVPTTFGESTEATNGKAPEEATNGKAEKVSESDTDPKAADSDAETAAS